MSKTRSDSYINSVVPLHMIYDLECLSVYMCLCRLPTVAIKKKWQTRPHEIPPPTVQSE